MADQTLKYALSGDSSGATAAFKDVAAAIQRAEDKADKFNSTVEKMKESFSRQVANMTQHSAAVERSVSGIGAQTQATGVLSNATSMLSGAVQTAVGALAAYGATQVIGWMHSQAAATLEYGAALQDLSDRYDISSRDIQIFATWAELSGASTEEMAKAIGKLEKNLAEGGKELAKFGITALDGKGAFLQLAAAVEKAPSHIEKVEIASAALGKGWEGMMPVLNAGADALQEMANNADLIDEESIRRLAEMDDKVTEMQQSFRTLGAEIVAAFGPVSISAIDFLRKKLKDFNDEFVRREDDKWVERLGGKYVSQGTYDLSNLKNLDGLSSKDIAPLLHGTRTKSGMVNSEGTFRVDSSVMDQAASAYNAALEREALAAQQTRLDKLDEAQAIRDRRAADAAKLDADKKKLKREKEGKEHLQFLNELSNQIELLRASDGERELIQIQQKYDAMKEKHKNNSAEIIAIEKAREAELQNYYLQQNFGRLAAERDAEMPQHDPTWSDAGSSFLRTQGVTYESYSMANPVGTEEDSASAESARSKNSPLGLQKATKEVEDLKKAWDALADSIAERASSELAPAILGVFSGGEDALSNLGDAASNIMKELLADTAKLILKWAILQGLAAMMGGQGPGDAGKFVFKGLSGGHADGTLSSPGGMKFLGERGPEPYETPYGQRGIATYGLYQVPAGTRVQSAGGGASMGTKEFHLHTTESDPIQVGEIFRRVVREEISLYESDKYRDRLVS